MSDKPRLENAIAKYELWIAEMDRLAASGLSKDDLLADLVGLLNTYRLHVDLEMIFDSEDDFLYRQKGQLKLDNSVLEEFLPRLMHPTLVPNLRAGIESGPTRCFASAFFESNLTQLSRGGALRLRYKDQDFALSRALYLSASHYADGTDSHMEATRIGYIAAEVKTNLDKTMFQEACATARDLRIAVPAAKYFLMVEWLDMTPVSTATTDIEEVLLIRGGKRLDSNKRKAFGSAMGRKKNRDLYEGHLISHPFRIDVFRRWLDHVNAALNDEDLVEADVLQNGYF